MVPREDYILFSGAANGAEAEFGACAEEFGVTEVNFTFEGHKVARTRGLRHLTGEELRRGDMSLVYVSRLLHRDYSDAPLIRRVLQTIWHQVNEGRVVYVVGKILPDMTVKGGTGWGAEFAKLCNKPLFVFDQERDGWFAWSDGERWEAVPGDGPTILHPHFVGTGTRFLEENGRKAIRGLFERAFAG